LILSIVYGPKITVPIAAAFIAQVLHYDRLKSVVLIASTIIITILVKMSVFGSYHNNSTMVLMGVLLIIYYLFYVKIQYFIISSYFRLAIYLHICIVLGVLFYIDVNYAYLYSVSLSSIDGFNDVNVIWRLLFWAKMIGGTDLFSFIFGVGIGTPLFDVSDPSNQFIVKSDPTALNRPYTLGLHNSYLTILVRMGLIGFILSVEIVIITLKKVVNTSVLVFNNHVLIVFYLVIISLFNVVIETPLFAGIYWGLLGIAYKSKNEFFKS
jgi:O-antigen ligase